VLPPSVSFATLVKGDMSRKAVNFRTLVTLAGNGGDVVISRVSIKDRLSDIATKLSYPLLLDSYTAAICTDYGVEKVMIEPWLSFELMLS
ncbi:hypothetical protein Tco_1486063, partial [Tanacetum coccineum]